MRSGITSLTSVSLVMFTCSILFVPVSQVYAWDGFSSLKKLGQEIHESIASIDPKWKQQVIVQNLAVWQAEKESLLNQGLPVPVELEKIVDDKKAKLDQIKTESSGAFSVVIDAVQTGQELIKIREYVATFHKLKNNEITPDQNTITTLESNVNNLNIVKKHCMPVSVNDLLYSQDPYDRLKNDYCKVLQDIPKETVMNSLVG